MGEWRTNYRKSDLASSERPRGRLANLGAEAISNAELIAILMRSEVEGMDVLQLTQKIL